MTTLQSGKIRHGLVEVLIELAVAAVRALWRWLLRHHRAFVAGRARRELHGLSDRTLKDIGLRRTDIDSLFR